MFCLQHDVRVFYNGDSCGGLFICKWCSRDHRKVDWVSDSVGSDSGVIPRVVVKVVMTVAMEVLVVLTVAALQGVSGSIDSGY